MNGHLLVVAGIILLLCLTAAQAQPPPGFTLHGRFSGVGGMLGSVVGPGPEPGSERLFTSHVYGGTSLEVVASDPATGKSDVFACPLPEAGAWGICLGPDNNVYIGTLPTAHIMKVDWAQKKLVDMGIPSATEQYLWELCVGTDKKLYGCTYPNAKLVRFDPATGKGEDLGRINETENYAREIAADDKGFIYIGVGMAKYDLVAYEIATGKHQSVLPADLTPAAGCGTVNRAADGRVYGAVGGKWFSFDGFTATPVPGNTPPSTPPLQLADGRTVSYKEGHVFTTDAAGKTQDLKSDYRGKELDIFRIGLGPDGRLYGSTAMPIHFFWADPEGDKCEEIAVAGGGEFYSFLAWQDKLIGAAYSAPSPIIIYKPGAPWKPGPTAQDNPWQVQYEGENSGWRPMAMIAGPQNLVYLGAVSGYGALGGPLCILDPVTGKVDQYMHLVKDQSVISLAVTKDNLIVGGTTVGGGGGSHATQTEAKLFLFDPVKREKVFETIPVPGAGQIDSLAVGRDGTVYGFAGETMFAFDPAARKVLASGPHGMGAVAYASVGPGPRGELYGVCSKGVFTIDQDKRQAKLIGEYPGSCSGFAIRGRDLYFTHGPQIISYRLPE